MLALRELHLVHQSQHGLARFAEHRDGEAERDVVAVVAVLVVDDVATGVLTPVFGEAGTASWPCSPSCVTGFEPIRPVPPITTIFMTGLPVSRDIGCRRSPAKTG